jgi:hypothetical protein
VTLLLSDERHTCVDLPKKCIRFADEFTSAYGPVLVIHALDAIVELTIYLSGRDGYPIAANRRSIFPPLSPHRKTSRRATGVHDARRFVL